jgi:hypothetical protein
MKTFKNRIWSQSQATRSLTNLALDFADMVRISKTSGGSMQSESTGTPLDPSGGTAPK